MKLFLTRTINILLIVIVLLVYQQQAIARSQVVDAYHAQFEENQVQTQVQTETIYEDGIHMGTADGFGGPMTVAVTVEKNKITKTEVTENSEDAEYLEKASVLLDKIVENQGTDGLDVVSGATFSSNGILDAVNHALEE